MLYIVSSAHLQPVLLLYELEQSTDQATYTPRKQRSERVAQEPGLGPAPGAGLGGGSGSSHGLESGVGGGSGSGVRSGRGPGGLVMDHSGGNSNNPCTTHSLSPPRLSQSEKGLGHDSPKNSSSMEQKGRSESCRSEGGGRSVGGRSDEGRSGGGYEGGSSGGSIDENGSTTATATTTTTPLVSRRPVSMGSGLFTSALSLLPWGYVDVDHPLSIPYHTIHFTLTTPSQYPRSIHSLYSTTISSMHSLHTLPFPYSFLLYTPSNYTCCYCYCCCFFAQETEE